MSAKEMFEKLDFENDVLSERIIGYKKIIHNHNKYITFINCDTAKYFTIIEDDRDNVTIDLEELQAINKQISELGWNDEN